MNLNTEKDSVTNSNENEKSDNSQIEPSITTKKIKLPKILLRLLHL